MKKVSIIPFLLSFHFAYAGTGGASDGIPFILSIIGLLSVIVAVLYLIEFIRNIIKAHKENKLAHLTDASNNENLS